MAGVGTGLTIGPLAIQARFAQPAERNAVVSALLLFVCAREVPGHRRRLLTNHFGQFRALGGTIGLAQCGAVLNGKVTEIITSLVRSNTLSPEDARLLADGLASGISSVQSIGALPPDVQTLVRDAFQQGSRWSFVWSAN